MNLCTTRSARCASAILALATASLAQVHYHPDGRPWSTTTSDGPDKDVPGWYYNLGVTGLRVELVESAPTHLIVRYVMPDSPAAGKVNIGDQVVGAGGATFKTPHENGHGEKVFGARGPIADFATALDTALQQGKQARLDIRVLRGEAERDLRLNLGKYAGGYTASFPAECAKSKRVLDRLLPWLVEQQRDDGSWGSAPHDTFAPLALLASGNKKYRDAIERNARFHARTTLVKDPEIDSLINWRYMAAGIMLAEYHLATGEKWVLPELEQIRDFLLWSQYTDPSQINPKAYQSHPGSVPTRPGVAEGGWGHNPGFEGYGPIAMITGQGALAFALIERCGVKVPRDRHEAAYAFLRRATSQNGYVWYQDSASEGGSWSDPGRTGVAGIANWVCPYDVDAHRAQALRHAAFLGAHPESFPDTHACPTMGMAYAAMAAHLEPSAWRRLLDQNRWWLVLSECPDGTFYYQPNRDNSMYGGDSRLSASAVVALVLSLPKRSLCITGRNDAATPAAPRTGAK